MYFDIEPKRRLEDFYNMEDELRAFIDSIARYSRYRLIVVKGLRRYGKTSLVFTELSLIKIRNHIFIDCRLLPPNLCRHISQTATQGQGPGIPKAGLRAGRGRCGSRAS